MGKVKPALIELAITDGESSEGPRRTAASTFYDRLRDEILMGVIAPGTRLIVDQIRERYGVGISPIREALNRLSREGIVQHEERKGFHVTKLTEQELTEIIETQIWLNETALRKSIERGDAAWEERVVLSFYRMSKYGRSMSRTNYVVNPERESLHCAFHMALLSACGSRWMLQYCAQLEDLFGRYRRFVMRSDFLGQSHGQAHRMLMDATLERNTESAVNLLIGHIQNMGKSAQRHLTKTSDRGSSQEPVLSDDSLMKTMGRL